MIHSPEYVSEKLDEHTVVLAEILKEVKQIHGWKHWVMGLAVGFSIATSAGTTIVTHWFTPAYAESPLRGKK